MPKQTPSSKQSFEAARFVPKLSTKDIEAYAKLQGRISKITFASVIRRAGLTVEQFQEQLEAQRQPPASVRPSNTGSVTYRSDVPARHTALHHVSDLAEWLRGDPLPEHHPWNLTARLAEANEAKNIRLSNAPLPSPNPLIAFLWGYGLDMSKLPIVVSGEQKAVEPSSSASRRRFGSFLKVIHCLYPDLDSREALHTIRTHAPALSVILLEYGKAFRLRNSIRQLKGRNVDIPEETSTADRHLPSSDQVKGSPVGCGAQACQQGSSRASAGDAVEKTETGSPSRPKKRVNESASTPSEAPDALRRSKRLQTSTKSEVEKNKERKSDVDQSSARRTDATVPTKQTAEPEERGRQPKSARHIHFPAN